MQAQAQEYFSPEEYLDIEAEAKDKSEYIDGCIIPMAGGSTNHNQIAGNFYAELNFAIKRQDYQVFVGDVRLWLPERRIYTYPDVMLIAGEPQYFNDRTDTITNPQLIVEVLSDSTQNYDRSGKFEAYRTIPEFQEYLLVDQTRIHIEQFVKTARKRWLLYEYDDEDESVALVSVELQIALADIYNKIRFEVAAAENP